MTSVDVMEYYAVTRKGEFVLRLVRSLIEDMLYIKTIQCSHAQEA